MSNGDRTRIPTVGLVVPDPSPRAPHDRHAARNIDPTFGHMLDDAPPRRDERSLQYAIHRPRRDATQPVSVAPEVHAVPTVTRRQQVTPGLAEMAEMIMDSIDVAFRSAQRGPGFLVSAEQTQVIRSGVRNGVMVVGEEIERLRGMLESFVDIIDPPGAPACFELDPDIVKAAAKALRAGMAVRR